MKPPLDQRKQDHINLCRDQDVEASDRNNGLTELSFLPCAMPELDWDDLDTSTNFLGQSFPHPLLITGMTGGIAQGEQINLRLAAAASKFNIPMGIGSQRIALENEEHQSIFRVKEQFPDLFLIGNLGIGQIVAENGVELCKRAVTMVGADALAIHVNVLQELIQNEGDRRFDGAIAQVGRVCSALQVPVMVKEVGCGMDKTTALALKAQGVRAIDVGGRGGTSWGYIEGLRSSDEKRKRLSQTFRNWGLSTAQCLIELTEVSESMDIVATGGIRSGLDVAKSLALGASMVGVGLPLFRAAIQSEAAVCEVIDEYLDGLRIAMLCTGSRQLAPLQHKLLGKPNPLAR